MLLFDQFEEFFTYPLAQQQRFADELSQLLHGNLPPEVAEQYSALPDQDLLAARLDVKAVFAIREDRLHLMDKLNPSPAIFGRRYALHPLPRAQAQEALERPAALPGFDTPAFAFSPEAMEKILDFLADEESRVETNQLQILAESFEKRAEQEGIARFTPENLGALKTIVKDYYLDRINALPAEADRLAARQPARKALPRKATRRAPQSARSANSALLQYRSRATRNPGGQPPAAPNRARAEGTRTNCRTIPCWNRCWN